jgi:signal transduction histidine kinase
MLLGAKRPVSKPRPRKRLASRAKVRRIDDVPRAKELRLAREQAAEARQQLVATAEILRVIRSTPTDLRSVLDAVVENAARLCASDDALIRRADGDSLRRVAHFGLLPEPPNSELHPIASASVGSHAFRERRAIHVEDIVEEFRRGNYSDGRDLQRPIGYRTVLAVPLLVEDAAIGVILIRRMEVRPFTDKQIELLQTFADQAVIAIENVRLFNETKEALERQTATSEVLRIVAQSMDDVRPVFNAILDSALKLFKDFDSTVWLVRDDRLVAVARGGPTLPPTLATTIPIKSRHPWASVINECKVVKLNDVANDPGIIEADRAGLLARGRKAALMVPLVREGIAIGSLSVSRSTPYRFEDVEVSLLHNFANQAVIAIENVRLFHELQEKNAQIEAVSRHKSEFLANMSHELRTPLNAILGFSEVLGERYFGELNDKQDEYVRDIRGSGEHLLLLINDILDLSKVEAGKMELELSDFDLPAALKNVVTLVRERAQRHGITVSVDLTSGLSAIRADERKLKQVMLNLLSNAVKFTPDGGAITVVAKPVGQTVEIAVADTGAGIAPEDLPSVFEEFKQVGADGARKAEGTGLGLPLAKKFVGLHGGELRVESKLGAGSTFTVVLPLG